jgi:hypothetical protein
MYNLVIQPRKYRLNLIQIEGLSSEYYGQCLEATNADELIIEFDNIANLNKFKVILNEKFLLDD